MSNESALIFYIGGRRKKRFQLEEPDEGSKVDEKEEEQEEKEKAEEKEEEKKEEEEEEKEEEKPVETVTPKKRIHF